MLGLGLRLVSVVAPTGQPLPSRVGLALVLPSTSTFTALLKVVSTALLPLLSATISRL
jgi:hypothetical protein